MKLVFEINYRGRFDRKCGCIYVGGQVDVHPDNVDQDYMTFVLIESILGQYGYSPDDLIYVTDPNKNLVDGLQLVFSDYDVAYLVAKYVDTPIVELYIVYFQSNVGEDGEDWENDEEGDDGGRVDYNDTWWDDKISDDEDVFDYLMDSDGPPTMPETDEGVEGDREDGDGADVEGGSESGDILDDGNGESGSSGNIKMHHLKMLRLMKETLTLVEVTFYCHQLLVKMRMVGFHLTMVWSSRKLT
jgi:hypothetical protein